MFRINNNVFLSKFFFNVSINNIVVAKCKSTLGGGGGGWTLHVESTDGGSK